MRGDLKKREVVKVETGRVQFKVGDFLEWTLEGDHKGLIIKVLAIYSDNDGDTLMDVVSVKNAPLGRDYWKEGSVHNELGTHQRGWRYALNGIERAVKRLTVPSACPSLPKTQE